MNFFIKEGVFVAEDFNENRDLLRSSFHMVPLLTTWNGAGPNFLKKCFSLAGVPMKNPAPQGNDAKKSYAGSG